MYVTIEIILVGCTEWDFFQMKKCAMAQKGEET